MPKNKPGSYGGKTGNGKGFANSPKSGSKDPKNYDPKNTGGLSGGKPNVVGKYGEGQQKSRSVS